jgi:DNA-binding transcriptional LysR family regulator
MDVEHLRWFLSVAELRSFSAAARRHFVTQPAVSLRIKSLEERVGQPLVERSGARVRLTPAGELFRDRCREAVSTMDRALSEVADLSGLKRGRLSIGAIDAAGIYLLPPVLRKYHHRHPGIDLVLRVEPSASLVEQVLAGHLDCAVITLPAGRPDLDVTPLEEETLVLVAPAGAGSSAAEVLARHPLIAYPPGSVTRGLIDAALQARRLEPRTAMELAHPEAILRMVEAGLGAAVLPERVASRSRARVVRIGSFRVRRLLGLVFRRGESPSPAAAAFTRLMMETRRAKQRIRSR